MKKGGLKLAISLLDKHIAKLSYINNYNISAISVIENKYKFSVVIHDDNHQEVEFMVNITYRSVNLKSKIV